MGRRNPARTTRGEYAHRTPAAVTQPVAANSRAHITKMPQELRDAIYEIVISSTPIFITVGVRNKGVRVICDTPLLFVCRSMNLEIKRLLKPRDLQEVKAIHATVLNFDFTALFRFLNQATAKDVRRFDDLSGKGCKLLMNLSFDSAIFMDESFGKWVQFADKCRQKHGPNALSMTSVVRAVPTGRKRSEFLRSMSRLQINFGRSSQAMKDILDAVNYFLDNEEENEADIESDAQWMEDEKDGEGEQEDEDMSSEEDFTDEELSGEEDLMDENEEEAEESETGAESLARSNVLEDREVHHEDEEEHRQYENIEDLQDIASAALGRMFH